MMKKTKRTVQMIALVMTACMTGVTFSACVGGNGQDFDNTKTQIFVQTYDGGLEKNAFDVTVKKFEEKYKDYILNGKTGVEVIIVPSKDTGASLLDNILLNDNEVFFVESAMYDNFRKSEHILEITDIVTEKLTEYGENESIADKLSAEHQAYYGQDGKYYGLQYAQSFEGFIIDEAMFYENGFFYAKAKDENPSLSTADAVILSTAKNADGVYSTLVEENGETYWETNNGEYLSKGPDGKYGTYDDGHAATYDEFFQLCDYIRDENITPIIMLGKGVDGGLRWMWQQLVADYEREETTLNYTFDGVSNYVVDTIASDGTVTLKGPTAITPQNYIDAYSTAGKYYGASFIERLMTNDGMHYLGMRTWQSTTTQYMAQEYFVSSMVDNEKYAFLFDGVWWENEAQDTLSLLPDEASTNRMFKHYALPKATGEKVGEQTVLFNTQNTLAVIKSGLGEKEEICKKFLQFCFTDESNRDYVINSNIPRAIKMNLTDSELAKMSHYGRSVYQMLNNEGVKVLDPHSNTEFFLKNQNVIVEMNLGYTKIDGRDENSFSTIFRTRNIDAKTFFEGIKERMKNMFAL